MTAVLDVSAAIEMILRKERAGHFQEALDSSSWVIAPTLYVAELSNVLWKYHRAKVIGHEPCIQYCESGIGLVDDFIELEDLWKEALAEGIKNGHSIYDMYYAVLARRHDATLITNDERLAAVCKRMKIEICG